MENTDTAAENPNANALSIYGQTDAAMDDFPVLKAFQQYIDAEQSKSRKRMILLCMFFGVLMTVLVAAFMVVLGQMNRDKQTANDQLIQFLMKERERPQTVVQSAPAPAANPANDAALKAMTDALTSLQKQITDQKRADEDEAARAATKAEIELERKKELEAARIRQQKAELEEAKRKLAAEKERLRQEEIERQRRRLYPEYYAQKEGVQAPSPAAQAPSRPEPAVQQKPRKVELSDADIDDILREVGEIAAEEDEELEKKKPEKIKSPKKNKKSEKKSDDKDDAGKPIEYFSDSEYALPVNVNGESAGFTIPLE